MVTRLRNRVGGFFLKGKFAQKGIPGHRDEIPCCGDAGYVLANRRSIESGHPSN